MSIERIEKKISYEEFEERFLKTSKPCIFENWLTKDWSSIKNWVKENGTINWDFLKYLFDKCVVPVVECKPFNSVSQDQKFFSPSISSFHSHPPSSFSFSFSSSSSSSNSSPDYNKVSYKKLNFSQFTQYIYDLNNLKKENNNNNNNNTQSQLLYYLKDWHCVKDNPELNFYQTPLYFSSDWLNEFWVKSCDHRDDYMFVYIGPKGSSTPLHTDVLGSYSWSVNVSGLKRWILHEPHLKNGYYDLNPTPDLVPPPSTIEVLQRSGEAIFVPSNWSHEVFNEEDTISINHNWINEFNVGEVWNSLRHQLTLVEREISHLGGDPDFREMCQLILKADSGMNFKDMFEFLEFIALRRFHFLDEIRNNYKLEEKKITCKEQDVFLSNLDEKKALRELEVIKKLLNEISKEMNKINFKKIDSLILKRLNSK